MDLDERTERALFRFSVIAPLVSGTISRKEAAQARRDILNRTYKTPDGRDWRISERTLRYWLRRYEKSGFEGLYDADRGTYGKCRAISAAVLEAAAKLRRQESGLSIRQILDLLPLTEELRGKDIEVDEISESTLNRQLNRRGARKRRDYSEPAGSYQRWEQKFVNVMWQADPSDGLWLPDPYRPSKVRKTYLISFIDDASRYVAHAQFYWDMQLPSLLDCFKKALLSKGKPEKTYWDNAWIFHSTTVKLLCAELGIQPKFSKVKRPAGRGKVERHIRTVQDGFLQIAEHADIKTLDELNQFFFAWLTEKYHKVEHKELGMSPLERWTMDRDRIERVSPAQIRRGLMLRCQRTVDKKTAEVRLDKVKYQASAILAGEKVEVRYHFDDASEIELWQRGHLIEVIKPVTARTSIDFSRKGRENRAEEKKKGVPYSAFKAYRTKLVDEHGAKLPSVPSTSDYLTESEWIELISELLSRKLGDGEDGYLRRFFFRYAPFERTRTRELLEMLVDVCGKEQHVGAYCERLLEGQN